MSDTEAMSRHQATVEAIGLANEPKAAPAAPNTDATKELPAAATPEEEAAKAEAADLADEDADDSATSDGTESPERRVRRNRLQERIDKITRDKYESDARAEALAARLAAIESQQQTQQVPADKPTLEAHGYDQDAYETALIAWAAGQERTQSQQRAQQQQAEQAKREREAKWNEKVDALEKKSPGAWDKATSAPIPYTRPMLAALDDSPIGPEIGAYLADHLDEAHRISRLNPVQQVRALDKIEAQLTGAPASAAAAPRVVPKTVTQAPPPAPALQSSAKAEKPLAEQSIEDRMAAIRAFEARR